MSNQDRVSRNLTCVGSVRVKGLVTSDIVQTMFDVCSTDNWLVIEHAHKLGAKKVGEFQGIVKTINGHERSTLPRYEVRVQMSDSNWTKIHCLGVKNIGWKPQIEVCRFQRLCKEFGVRSSEVDNTAGPIGLLLGLKNQSLLATRVASFQSTRFPEVGLYASPVLQNKYIFVGHEGLSVENSPTTNYRISAYDGSLHKYIMQEQQVKLTDIKCEVCTKSFDCKNCKDMNSPVSIIQLEESNAIRQAMKVLEDPTDKCKRIISIEYPTRHGVSLKDLYTEENCNRAMALKSSESLRNRLCKINKLQEFHSQISESVAKGHIAEVTDELAARYKGLPISYQLINYVEKPSSATTKLRMVTNSSIPRIGGSLNENLAQGINSLNSSLAVLNRFSAFPFAILTDLSQAYRSIHTGDATNSVRRFYWFKNLDDPATVTEYCMQRMQFGDKPAGNILAEAINLISNQQGVSSDCRDFLKFSFYVDDGALSSNSKTKLERLANEFPSIFAKFNFATKHVIKSWDLTSL